MQGLSSGWARWAGWPDATGTAMAARATAPAAMRITAVMAAKLVRSRGKATVLPTTPLGVVSFGGHGRARARPIDRRRRHPGHHPGARAGRARAACGPPHLRAVRPDRGHLHRRHPGLRALRAGPAASRRAGGPVRRARTRDLRPLAVPAHP